MKLHQDRAAARHIFTGYGPNHVEVNGNRYQRGLIVLPDEIIVDWCNNLAELTPAQFEVLVMRAPEIILLGTGRRQVFPQPAQYAGPIRAGIGVEVMDTAAACRTYNILAAEGRRVAAALIIEAD